MSQPVALREWHVGTFLPYQPDAPFATLLPGHRRNPELPMFIFRRPLVAPLLALAITVTLVLLDTLVDLSALF